MVVPPRRWTWIPYSASPGPRGYQHVIIRDTDNHHQVVTLHSSTFTEPRWNIGLAPYVGCRGMTVGAGFNSMALNVFFFLPILGFPSFTLLIHSLNAIFFLPSPS